jgi:hypothetical protein
MKKFNLLSLLLLTLVLGACQFNQSVIKDLTSGAFTRGDGIGSHDVIIEINGEVENRTNFINGEKVRLVFNKITGLKRVKGNVFPGMSLIILKNNKDTMTYNEDLFADMVDGIDLETLQFYATFVATLPYKNHEKYKVFVKIWDKKGTGTFQYELPFTMAPNKFLKIKSKNITYTDIYLWNQSKKMVVVNEHVGINDTLILILEGLEGLESVNDKVYPALSIDITSKNGHKVLTSPNVFEQYRNDGVDRLAVKNEQLLVTITIAPGAFNNPNKFRAALTDLKSNKRIDISAELEIK